MANTHLVVRRIRVNQEITAYPLFKGSRPFARTYKLGWHDAYKELHGRYPTLDVGGKISIIDMQEIQKAKTKAYKEQTRLDSEPCRKCGATFGERCKHSRSEDKGGDEDE